MSRYGDDDNAWIKENLFNTVCNFLLDVSVSDYDTPVQCLLGIVGDAIAEIDSKGNRYTQDLQRKLDNAHEALINATKIIKSQPDIVLCKDCKYGNMSIDDRPYRLPCRQNDQPQDWYCADGKAVEQNG